MTEDALPPGWDFVNVDCSASTGVTPHHRGPVTFDIDDADDILDCTYTNRRRRRITVVKGTADGAGRSTTRRTP